MPKGVHPFTSNVESLEFGKNLGGMKASYIFNDISGSLVPKGYIFIEEALCFGILTLYAAEIGQEVCPEGCLAQKFDWITKDSSKDFSMTSLMTWWQISYRQSKQSTIWGSFWIFLQKFYLRFFQEFLLSIFQGLRPWITTGLLSKIPPVTPSAASKS